MPNLVLIGERGWVHERPKYNVGQICVFDSCTPRRGDSVSLEMKLEVAREKRGPYGPEAYSRMPNLARRATL